MPFKHLIHSKIVVVAVFLFIFALRLPGIDHSPFEYGSWRQSDTESMARNFVEHRVHILYPQLNYDGPMPNYAQLELQLTTWIIAMLYRWFGYHYALARIVPIAFFMGSAYFLFLIAKRYLSKHAAIVSVLLYGLLPINLLYSRAIMPESAALFFYLGSFYFFNKWISADRKKDWLLSICFLALGISQKIPVLLIIMPMTLIALRKFGRTILFQYKFLLFVVLSILPSLLYFVWLGEVAEHRFVSGIATKHILPNLFTAVGSREAWFFFSEHAPRSFTILGLLLSAMGIVLLQWKGDFPIIVWLIAVLLELAAIAAVIKFDYYLIFAAPLVALLGAKSLDYIMRHRSGFVLGLTVLALFSIQSIQIAKPVILNTQKVELLQQASIIQAMTEASDLIVSGSEDPSLLNASRRQGWRVDSTLAEDPIAELHQFIASGAKYFVPLKGYIYQDDGSYTQYLDDHFSKIEVPGGYSFYRLQ